MRSKPIGLLVAAAVAFSFVRATAQEAAPPSPELKVGPYAVPKHWSKNKYPESVPEGDTYYIIVKGDTLWDLAQKFLKNPLLWPQIWNDNKYITDAHWIYPGDPLLLKKVEVVAEKAGETPEMPTGEEAAAGAGQEAAAGPEGPVENPLYPATEQITLQCAPQILPARDDESLKVLGSEEHHLMERGTLQITYSDRDILYLNKGSNAGVKPGDVLSIHRPADKVKHPKTGKTLGTKVITLGWARVIMAQETSAQAVVEQACSEINQGDYLKAFEKMSVPLLIRRPPPDRATPPSGKAQGYVVSIGEDRVTAGSGNLVFVDVGSQAGVAPGNLMTVFRFEYPKRTTARHVLGELAVLSVKDNMALAKVNYSTTWIEPGDSVELR